MLDPVVHVPITVAVVRKQTEYGMLLSRFLFLFSHDITSSWPSLMSGNFLAWRKAMSVVEKIPGVPVPITPLHINTSWRSKEAFSLGEERITMLYPLSIQGRLAQPLQSLCELSSFFIADLSGIYEKLQRNGVSPKVCSEIMKSLSFNIHFLHVCLFIPEGNSEKDLWSSGLPYLFGKEIKAVTPLKKSKAARHT